MLPWALPKAALTSSLVRTALSRLPNKLKTTWFSFYEKPPLFSGHWIFVMIRENIA